MITIGQQGKLGNEILTVVSFNDKTFTCDNGKTYMIAFSKWMTNPTTIVEIKKRQKTTKKIVSEIPAEKMAEIESHLAYLEATGRDSQTDLNKSTFNYRNGKSGMSSLTK